MAQLTECTPPPDGPESNTVGQLRSPAGFSPVGQGPGPVVLVTWALSHLASDLWGTQGVACPVQGQQPLACFGNPT